VLAVMRQQTAGASVERIQQRGDGAGRCLLVPTSQPSVTNARLLSPTTLSAMAFRVQARARAGLLPMPDHRQPHRVGGAVNPLQLCVFCCHHSPQPPVETSAHLLCACPRFLNPRCLRHDDMVGLVCGASTTACAAEAPGRFVLARERTLQSFGEERPGARLLRPGAFLIDHEARTVTPLELTISDELSIQKAEAARYAKYGAWLKTTTPSCLGHGAAYRYAPLQVFVMGVFGSIASASERALTVLRTPDEARHRLLVNAATGLASRNAQVVRLQFSNAGAHRVA
jgi:hypothetical protein